MSALDELTVTTQNPLTTELTTITGLGDCKKESGAISPVTPTNASGAASVASYTVVNDGTKTESLSARWTLGAMTTGTTLRLIYDYTDEDNYNFILVKKGTVEVYAWLVRDGLELWKRVAGVESRIDTAQPVLYRQVEIGDLRFQFLQAGSVIRMDHYVNDHVVSLDDVPVIQVADSSIAAGGKIGFQFNAATHTNAITKVQAEVLRVRYVATTGSDAAAGSKSTPLKTVAGIIGAMTQKSIGVFEAGTWTQGTNALQTLSTISGTSREDGPLMISAAGATVTWNATATGHEMLYCNGARKFWRWHGMTLDGDLGGGSYAFFTVHIFNGATDWTFSDFHVKNCTKSGFLTARVTSPYDPYGGHWFSDCSATHVGRGSVGDHGWYGAARYNEYWYCQAHGGSGISLGHGLTLHSHGVTDGTDFSSINYCLAEGFTATGVSGFAIQEGANLHAIGNVSYGNTRGMQIVINASSSLIEWNLAYDNTQYGFYIGGLNSTDIDFVNNTATENPGIGLYIHADATTTFWDNNILYNNGTNLLDNSASTTDGGHNLVGINPIFVNPGLNDYRLQATSPAKDSGDDLTARGVVAYDLDGVAIDGNWPAGCFEYSDAPPIGATPPTVNMGGTFTGIINVDIPISIQAAGQGGAKAVKARIALTGTLTGSINTGGGTATVAGGT